MKSFSCILVDDDEIARLTITSYVKRMEDVEIVGVFATAEDALIFLDSHKVDIAFLDIELPGASGLELRKKALEVPACVFISSHSESAAETYELQTLDFIVKPFKFERFEAAMTRIRTFMELRLKVDLFDSTIGGDVIYIKSGHDQIKVKLHEIMYLEALKNYTLLVTESRRHCVLSNLGEILQDEKFHSFLRVHRSYAVQKHFIQRIKSQELELINNTMIPIGRSFKEGLNALL